ncbi:response regulator [Wenzhouxiangella limi]|uniref:Response regulator n=1 Tax=Wenzhouxiangella limi TaxID=2707351 RepID=A0A845V3A2_9GAMM|nr:response regulator [Wenzhouxiangella limi]NDY94475.1 response regulator [Wenzhouxiangella limi]
MSSSADKILGRLSVLVVDDHDINREFLHAGLSGVVGEVAAAEDGRAAVALCQRRRFDVVLMDLHMPHMDGLIACQSIRQSESPSQNATILMLTADARPEERARLLDQGVDGYLNKPITIPQLLAAILEQVAPGVEAHALPQTRLEETRLIAPEQALDAANGDPALVARMSRLFAAELSEKLPELDAMIGSGEHARAAELLHQWRGACGFAGAARLHQVCGDLRQCLLQPNEPSAGSAYVEFLRTAQATGQALSVQETSPA